MDVSEYAPQQASLSIELVNRNDETLNVKDCMHFFNINFILTAFFQ